MREEICNGSDAIHEVAEQVHRGNEEQTELPKKSMESAQI